MELDKTDKRILRILQKNGRISNSDLANKVGSSTTACWNRTKRLIKEGYIEEIKAILNPNKLGLSILVAVGVVLDSSTKESFSEFEQAVKKIPAILECLLLAGEFDYWLKIRAKDIHSFNRLHANLLLRLPRIRHLRTFFTLNEVKANQDLIFE